MDSSFERTKGYSKFAMQLNGGEVPSISGSLIIGSKKYSADFLFDMGATGCLFLNQGFLQRNDLYGSMEVIGASKVAGAGRKAISTERALLPGFVLGIDTLKQTSRLILESPR